MGAQVNNNKNITIDNINQEIIEYEGYEEFAIVEIGRNTNKKEKEKIRPNMSLNNHSGGSSIGKYGSDHDVNKIKDKQEEHNEDNHKLKNESKFPHNTSQEQIQNEDDKKEKEEGIINNNNNNEINNDNQKLEDNIDNHNEEKNLEAEKKNIEDNKNINEVQEITNPEKEKEKLTLTEKDKKENLNNIENNNGNEEKIQNNMEYNEDKNDNMKNSNTNILNQAINNTQENNGNNDKNENQDQNKDDNHNVNYNKKEENNKNINEEFNQKKIILPNINTIISQKVLEEGAGNELLFMSNLNKVVHISIKERVKYSEKFCITTKDNFLIYETRENYLKVKKPLAIIPINSIKNVVLFKLTKKIMNYDHFYIEFQLNENNKNNIFNQIDTFYINDLDNTNNENKEDTALVLFKTEEKNLAKKWYVLLKYLLGLRLKN